MRGWCAVRFAANNSGRMKSQLKSPGLPEAGDNSPFVDHVLRNDAPPRPAVEAMSLFHHRRDLDLLRIA